MCAKKLLVHYVQNQVYRKEFHSLKSKGHVAKSSPLHMLCPAVRDDVIVIDGRIKHAAIPDQYEYPMIPPCDHALSRLIAREFYEGAHLVTDRVLSKLRSKIWIVGARGIIKKVNS